MVTAVTEINSVNFVATGKTLVEIPRHTTIPNKKPWCYRENVFQRMHFIDIGIYVVQYSV